MQLIAIYITFPNKETAEAISRRLLDQKLIACSNIIPAHSLYNWEGELQQDTEYISISKSINQKWEDIQSTVSEHHPYDVPCIWKVRIEASKSYTSWVASVIE